MTDIVRECVPVDNPGVDLADVMKLKGPVMTGLNEGEELRIACCIGGSFAIFEDCSMLPTPNARNFSSLRCST